MDIADFQRILNEQLEKFSINLKMDSDLEFFIFATPKNTSGNIHCKKGQGRQSTIDNPAIHPNHGLILSVPGQYSRNSGGSRQATAL